MKPKNHIVNFLISHFTLILSLKCILFQTLSALEMHFIAICNWLTFVCFNFVTEREYADKLHWWFNYRLCLHLLTKFHTFSCVIWIFVWKWLFSINLSLDSFVFYENLTRSTFFFTFIGKIFKNTIKKYVHLSLDNI